MGAGFVGLAVAVIFLLGTVVTIVELTNRKFEGHKAAAAAEHAPAANAPADTAPAATTPAATAPADTAPAAH